MKVYMAFEIDDDGTPHRIRGTEQHGMTDAQIDTWNVLWQAYKGVQHACEMVQEAQSRPRVRIVTRKVG